MRSIDFFFFRLSGITTTERKKTSILKKKNSLCVFFFFLLLFRYLFFSPSFLSFLWNLCVCVVVCLLRFFFVL